MLPCVIDKDITGTHTQCVWPHVDLRVTNSICSAACLMQHFLLPFPRIKSRCSRQACKAMAKHIHSQWKEALAHWQRHGDSFNWRQMILLNQWLLSLMASHWRGQSQVSSKRHMDAHICTLEKAVLIGTVRGNHLYGGGTRQPAQAQVVSWPWLPLPSFALAEQCTNTDKSSKSVENLRIPCSFCELEKKILILTHNRRKLGRKYESVSQSVWVASVK